MRLFGRARGIALATAAVLLVPAAAGGAPQRKADVELAGIFAVGGLITGSALLDSYLYITTSTHLLIYDVSESTSPVLVSSTPSVHQIYGELISTNGRTLLLNDGFGAAILDVWDVEDKSNPVLVGTLNGIDDEHVSCVLDCRWAYGSNGTIVDLKRPNRPEKMRTNWLARTGLKGPLHRADEFRSGFLVTAPLRDEPAVVDARDPLHPRVVARLAAPPGNIHLFSSWPRGGRERYLFSSIERSQSGDCSSDGEGALLSFDTKGWPGRSTFRPADRFKIEGAAGSDSHDCAAYYFSFNPAYRGGGLLVLPYGAEGTRVVRVDDAGEMTEVGSFWHPIMDVWHAFWVSEEIFYALNLTGEVYVLRYT